ncbi:MAG: hypothetical protein ACJ8CR_04735 [Roseiflexaceae bacterium]
MPAPMIIAPIDRRGDLQSPAMGRDDAGQRMAEPIRIAPIDCRGDSRIARDGGDIGQRLIDIAWKGDLQSPTIRVQSARLYSPPLLVYNII